MLQRFVTRVLHQILCPYLLVIFTAFLTFTVVGVSRGTSHTASSLLTMNPFYPIQVGIGLAAGYLVGRYTKWSFARWTWVVPATILLIAIAFAPVPATISRLAYFFASSGLPKQGMVPLQTAVTMPLYLSVAYSLSAWMGALGRIRGATEAPLVNE